MTPEYTIKNAGIVSAGRPPRTGALGVRNGRISPPGRGIPIDLQGNSWLYPSLVNTHDHLQGNYRPPVGPPPGRFYSTWLPWDQDLKASSTFEERSRLSREDLYALSGYKCLFSGVTTVHDHFPHEWNQEILPTLPIRAISDYCLAHEAVSYDLQWGDGVVVEHQRAVERDWPFITHLAEGFDEEAMHSVETLERLRVLDSRCLLIHCIGFSDKDIDKVARAKASVSWCGFSNKFMFNVTCKVRKMLRAGINLCIGTDSSATGSANLLSEMRFDRELYRGMYGEDLGAERIFRMVTCNGARAFLMEDRIGALEEGKLADLLVLRAREEDPFENLVNAAMEDIELLCLEGTPLYGELRFLPLLGDRLPEGWTEITVGNRPRFVRGDPAGLYRSCREKIGFKKTLDFLPFEPDPGGCQQTRLVC